MSEDLDRLKAENADLKQLVSLKEKEAMEARQELSECLSSISGAQWLRVHLAAERLAGYASSIACELEKSNPSVIEIRRGWAVGLLESVDKYDAAKGGK